jgi:hypothetical protein
MAGNCWRLVWKTECDMENKLMRDDELDRLLSAASQPMPSTTLQERIIAQASVPQASNIVAFPLRKKSTSWLIGLPLAASLAIGLWFGTSDLSSTFLNTASSTLISDSTGFEDVADLIEGNLT